MCKEILKILKASQKDEFSTHENVWLNLISGCILDYASHNVNIALREVSVFIKTSYSTFTDRRRIWSNIFSWRIYCLVYHCSVYLHLRQTGVTTAEITFIKWTSFNQKRSLFNCSSESAEIHWPQFVSNIISNRYNLC